MENWVLVALLASAILAIAGISSIGLSFGLGSSSNQDEEDQPLKEKKPNIVFIMLDDLGYNDISWNNPLIHMPNLDKLARSGVILNRNYVNNVCTPSRGELLTGKYAHRLGLQSDVVLVNRVGYLPLGEKLLSERLRDQGYSTHLLGKWHAGHCRLDYMPTRRGFDTFYGTLSGYIDSYTHCAASGEEPDIALDWYDQESPDYSHQDIHVTELLRDRALSILQEQKERPFFMFLSFFAPHTPIQVPRKYLEAYPENKDDWYRGYWGMISHADEAVGQVVAMLKSKGLFNNTIIAMTSDNGGYVGPGSNFPLRGVKHSTYEGGHRVPGFISGPPSIIKKYGYISNERFHITDWLPTLVSMAHGQIDAEAEGLDGLDQSSTLTMGSKTKRREMVYHIDTFSDSAIIGYATISYDDYKLIVGSAGMGDGWEQDGTAGYFIAENVTAMYPRHGPKVDVKDHSCSGSFDFTYNRTSFQIAAGFSGSIPSNRHQLFNIKADPEERIDLSAKMPEKVKELKELLQKQMEKEIQPPNPDMSPTSRTQRDNAWVTGWC